MKQTIMLATLSGLLVLSCSHKNEKPKDYEVMRATLSDTAKVSNVDYKKKLITLNTNNGPVTLKGDEVQNLNKIKTGDTVKAEYEMILSYTVNKSGNLHPAKYSSDTWTAKPGQSPAAGMKSEATASAIVTDINRANPSVTLKNGAGDIETFKVQHPERLKDLSIGDIVNIKYSEAMALKIEKENSTSL